MTNNDTMFVSFQSPRRFGAAMHQAQQLAAMVHNYKGGIKIVVTPNAELELLRTIANLARKWEAEVKTVEYVTCDRLIAGKETRDALVAALKTLDLPEL